MGRSSRRAPVSLLATGTIHRPRASLRIVFTLDKSGGETLRAALPHTVHCSGDSTSVKLSLNEVEVSCGVAYGARHPLPGKQTPGNREAKVARLRYGLARGNGILSRIG